MVRLTLKLLGPFQARRAAGTLLALPTRKVQALLGYLAFRPGQPHAREKLTTLLWGDTGERRARQSFRQALSSIRKAAGAHFGLVVEGEAIRLGPSAVDVDVPLFEQLVADGTPDALERAASLYAGDLLEGLAIEQEPFEEWLRTERQRLRELAVDALAKLLAHQSRSGAVEPAIQTAVRLLSLDPLAEAAHRALIRLYARQGRRGAAFKQYQLCVEVLQRELGAEPEHETRQLYQDLLQERLPEPATTAGPASRRSGDAARRLSPVRPGTPRRDIRLIGRHAELAQLRRAVHAAGRGAGRTVMVLGEAGIGKSRLVGELLEEALNRGGRTLLGRCYESEQILPFGPWIDALRASEIIADPDGLQDLSPVWRAELARLLPELREPDSRVVTHPQDFHRLFEAMAQLLTWIASQQPLLMVMEDLHWADETSLRLFAFIGRRLATSTVLLVATAREEELAGAPALRRVLEELQRELSFDQFTLGPLSRPETLQLVRSLTRAGRADAPVARLGQQVWEVSEGNPFMVVETMRALHEGVTPDAPTALPLPRRVREVIAGRLERLTERPRRLVAVAAVIGREFEFGLLYRAAGVTPSEAAEGMEELVRRRVIHGAGDRFDFVHDRIREVAYQELLPPFRKVVHGQVAEALEDLYAATVEPHCPAIAMHYQEAQVWDRALIYLRRAGAHAFNRSASREAVGFFERALVVLAHLPESRETLEHGIDLRFELRNSLYLLGELERILTYLLEAEGLAQRLDDPRRRGWVSLYMSAHLWLMGNGLEAGTFAEHASAIAEPLGDLALRVWASYYLGLARFASGTYREAQELLGALVESLGGHLTRERLGMAGFPSVIARGWLARALAEGGAFDEGIAHGREGSKSGKPLTTRTA